jgi:DNA polymerase-3 subunit delta
VRIKPDQLPDLLGRSLAPVYLIAGPEPLLVQECRDLVIEAAHKQGFAERDTFQVEGRFNWDDLEEASGTMSLFSSRRILDIRIPSSKPGIDGAKRLTRLVEAADPDTLLLVSGGEWSKKVSTTKWAGTLASAGVLVEIWPLHPHQLPAWINTRMKRAGLSADPDAISLLAQLVEGNLLAAQQEIDKLLLSGIEHRLTVEDISQAVADSSRFSGFRLIECMLAGNLSGSLRVAAGLKRTGTAIQMVVAVLQNELQLLAAAMSARAAGENEASFFKRMRIWQARQTPIRQALGRLTAEHLDRSLTSLALIDRQGKGMARGDPWQTLDRLLCDLCGKQLTGS